MPGSSVSVENETNTTITTTDEVVVATLTGVSQSSAGRRIRFSGSAKITTAANTTALNLRIRRDSLTGTEISESNPETIEAATGSTEDRGIEADDAPAGEIFNATYVLTIQATAATANGTCVYAYLRADSE